MASTAPDNWDYVHHIVGKANSSFWWGMRILPKRGRKAIYAVYAFSRIVDDIADSDDSPESKQRQLSGWHQEIDNLFQGKPQHPVTKAIEEVLLHYQLPQEEFHALIQGMEIDAKTEVRMESMDDLLRYCRRVAGAVGMLCIPIFGLVRSPAPGFAVTLGNAFQLTNILRDIKEDLAINRLYIPSHLLRKYDVNPDLSGSLIQQTGFAGVCDFLAAYAISEYEKAERLMNQLGWWRTRPPALMKAVYKDILDRLISRGWTNWTTSIRPSKLERLQLMVRNGLR